MFLIDKTIFSCYKCTKENQNSQWDDINLKIDQNDSRKTINNRAAESCDYQKVRFKTLLYLMLVVTPYYQINITLYSTFLFDNLDILVSFE